MTLLAAIAVWKVKLVVLMLAIIVGWIIIDNL